MNRNRFPPCLAMLCAAALNSQACTACDGAGKGVLAGPLAAATSLSAGNFLIRWDPTRGGRLTVHHRDDPARPVFSSAPGRAFVEAARGVQRVSGSRGFFEVHDDREAITTVQTVNSVTAGSDGVVISGYVFEQQQPRPGGDAHPAPPSAASISTGVAAAPSGASVYRFELRAASEHHLAFRLALDRGSQHNRIYLIHEADPDEAYFGFGERFTHVDMRGRRVPTLVQEQGIGRGAQPVTFLTNLFAGAGGDWSNAYAAVPQYVTSRGRAFLLTNSEVSVFDLTQPTRIRVELHGSDMRGRIIHARDPLQAIERVTEYTGRMQPLPDWMHGGAVLGMMGGATQVRDRLALMRAHGVPISALFLQDWVGTRETALGLRLWWNWEADPNRYGDWPAFVREMRDAGYHVLSYINPMLVDPSAKQEVAHDLFAEAKERGFLVRNPQGEPYPIGNGGFEAYLIDLSNPEARGWIKSLIKERYLRVGVSGWMGDFGEALPFDAVIANGDAAKMHNRYPEEWARVQREAIAEEGRTGEVVFFSRSGFTRSPSYSPLFWLGDQNTSWDAHDGMKSAVTGLLSSGFSGYSLNHGDIGGYTSFALGPFVFHARERELLMRWAELSAFTPVFRTHEGLLPDADHQVDTDSVTLSHFARMAKLFVALFDYRRNLMFEAATRGYPLVRHLILHYPDDPVAAHTAHQFMLGADMLVAPVMDPGQDSVSAYLPAGEWVHLWSGASYDSPDRGMHVHIPAPVGEPAAFYRRHSPLAETLRGAMGIAGLPVPPRPHAPFMPNIPGGLLQQADGDGEAPRGDSAATARRR